MRKIIFLLFLLSELSLFGQTTVEQQIQLITPDVIGNVNFDKEPFFEWFKKLSEEIESTLKNESGDAEVVVVLTLHKTGKPDLQIGARPSISAATIKSLETKINKLKTPVTLFTDYSFFIINKINKGCANEKMDYTPKILSPLQASYTNFMSLTLTEKRDHLQNWMKNEILPLIAHFGITVDAKFQGVLNFGTAVKEKKYQKSTIEQLTDSNPDYWRAVVEMEQGNQIIPFAKVCLHIANAEFDKAKRLLLIVNFFSKKGTLANVLYDEISGKLDALDAELNTIINEGIEMHDAKNYDKAIAHYKKHLKNFPNSAWLNYELYYSTAEKAGSPELALKEWAKFKEDVYACDPLYPLNVHANTGKEGYLLFRRNEINDLFKTEENYSTDIVKYADIAFDLENYSFAAQLYWLALSHFDKLVYEDRNILAYFLYSLDKLGDKEIIKNFKDDYTQTFKDIEAERKKLMEENVIYQSFEKKE